jgi:hypothetical protein
MHSWFCRQFFYMPGSECVQERPHVLILREAIEYGLFVDMYEYTTYNTYMYTSAYTYTCIHARSKKSRTYRCQKRLDLGVSYTCMNTNAYNTYIYTYTYIHARFRACLRMAARIDVQKRLNLDSSVWKTTCLLLVAV